MSAMNQPEPGRVSPGGRVSRRMSVQARRDTAPEMSLRRALHARDLRYRVQFPVPGLKRRRIDIAFTRIRLAVFVDGCFWHGCPEHGVRPRANSDWWDWKLKRNSDRDRDTDRVLLDQGWSVVRVWEHDCPTPAADEVTRLVRAIDS